MTVKVQGFDELEAVLHNLPKAMGRNALRKVARGALEPMAAAARGLAPIEEGKLRTSIAVSEKRTRRVARSGRFDKRTGLEMAMGPAGGTGALNYATFVEFGTINTAAKPFMRPAWDGGAGKALDYVEDNLAREVHAAAGRFAKRKLKAS